MADDPFRFDRTGVGQEPTYATYGCNVFKEDPETPDKLRPDVLIRREFDSGKLTAPDGREIDFWGFVDPDSPNPAFRQAVYPSPPMRVKVGQVVHTHMKSRKGPHTIHHHGILPTTFNDGVGHVSFEAGEYTYQWKPHQPGTNIYHCHRNTVLHFEMGMFGLIIVDPPEGWGWLTSGGRRYNVEKAWVADDMDPRWHELSHDDGMCGEDVGLNRFEPKYFLLSGVFNNRTMTHRDTVVTARVGDSILIRLLNASYSVLRVTLGIDAEVHGIDGSPLGKDPWNRPFTTPANTPFDLTSAQRRNLIIKPTRTGVFRAKIEFLHWITGEIQDEGRGVINTKIVVT
ncbi:MAG: multicopper oxidase domain-containing protein [Sphingomonas bacterium]|nr:multicopper oxidase domain-containing protein [Sphingomonas bacterium]